MKTRHQKSTEEKEKKESTHSLSLKELLEIKILVQDGVGTHLVQVHLERGTKDLLCVI